MLLVSCCGLLSLMVNFSFAKSVGTNTAAKVALNYFKFYTAQKEASVNLNSTLYSSKGSATFYVFDAKPIGFIIIAADDRSIPVLGYSTEGNFITPEKGTNIEFVLNRRGEEMQYIIDNNLAADEAMQKQWTDGINNTISRKKSGSSVNPLLINHYNSSYNIRWDQGCYFNALCPTDAAQTASNACGKVWTGCVATSMAQIMDYWQFPKTGTGSHSYNSSYGNLSANYTTTSYGWATMKPFPTSAAPAIATLMYDCGVAVNMGYGVNGSGAQTVAGSNSAKSAFGKYFKYNTSKIINYNQQNGNYTNTQWLSLIENELNLSRPILYSGFDPSGGGHAWVCDGYDMNDKLHMNWGWSGQDNQYYAVGVLNPSSLGAGGGSGGGFNANDEIILGIEPSAGGDMYEPNNTYANRYNTNIGFSNDETDFTTDAATMGNITDTDFYAFNLPTGYNYFVTASFYDVNINNTMNFTEDALGDWTNDGINYNGEFDDTLNSPFTIAGSNKPLVFRVYSWDANYLGSYQLHVHIKRTVASGVETVAQNSFEIFPNPAANNISIAGKINSNSKLVITNQLGQTISDEKIGSAVSAKTIDVSQFSNGVYFITVKNAAQSITKKVIVNH